MTIDDSISKNRKTGFLEVPCSHLMGFMPEGQSEPRLCWRLLQDAELPDDALDQGYLRTVYSDVPFKTAADVQLAAEEHAKQVRIGWSIVFVWAVVVPVSIKILAKTSNVISWIVLTYSFGKALVKALKLMGRWRQSPRELQQEREDLEMRHHHYHCKRNAEAFLRLKLENFERWERERILEEAKSLKQGKGEQKQQVARA